MEKFTYKKIANITLRIDLHNGYEVAALAKHNLETQKYEVSFYIKNGLVEDLMFMDDFSKIEFNTNSKFIYSAILKYVAKNFEAGNFNKYINRCKYYHKCFDFANEHFEKEQLNHAV